MPLLISPSRNPVLDYRDIPFERLKEDAPHMAVSLGIGIIARNPYVSLGVGVVHAIFHFGEVYRDSRGVGGPSGTTQSPPPASKRAPESRKVLKAKSAHGFRKTKGVSARGKCPKGHYWSFKQKKCVKSKFRQ